MTLKNIDAIIFDLGGVILNIDYNLTAKKFELLNVPNFQLLFSKQNQNNFFDLFETGNANAREFRNEIRKINPKLIDSDIDEAWNSMLLDLPHKRIEFIIELKNKYDIFLLSNTNEIHVKEFLKIADPICPNNNFRNIFNGCYFSNEIGLRKPNEEIFKFVIEKNSLIPSRTLFIDDSLQHINGASKLGINTHHLLVEKESILTVLQPEMA